MKKHFHLAVLCLAAATGGRAQNITTNLETGVIWLPVKDAATHDMIRTAAREADPLSRVKALAALAIIGDPADVALIRPLLNDPVAAVREQAGLALGKTPPPVRLEKPPVLTLAESLDGTPALPAVRDGLAHPNVVVQQAAADAVGRLRLGDLAPALLPLLKSPDSVLRRHVCEALGKSGHDQGPSLAALLAQDEDPFVQRAAAEALLALHTDPDRDALIALLKNSRAIVRAESAMALGRWGQPAIALSLHGLLHDNEPLVVKAVASALGRLGNPESKQPLLEVLPTDHTIAQDRIAWALGELHAGEAVTALIATLGNGGELAQAASAEALGKIGDPAAIPPLQKAIAATDMSAHGPLTRQSAFEALRLLGDRTSQKRAMQFITEKVVPPPKGTTEWQYDMPDTRTQAVRYLEFLGDPKIVDELFEKLKDMPPYPLRKTIATMITKLSGKPYMAAFSMDYRSYWIESSSVNFAGKTPDAPGLVPVP